MGELIKFNPEKDKTSAEIPEELKSWRDMSHKELEQAFEKTPKDFQDAVYTILSRNETSLQWILNAIEKDRLNSLRGSELLKKEAA